MSAREIMDSITKARHIPRLEAAKAIGLSRQHLNIKIHKGLLRFTEVCRICDAFNLRIDLFDHRRKRFAEFDSAAFGASGNGMYYNDAESLLDSLGFDVVLVDVLTESVLQRTVGGYGRRVRAWIDGVDYDTAQSSAIATGLKMGNDKYDVEDPKELYKSSEGRWFFAVYGRTKDYIRLTTEETAQAFIKKYGILGE